MQVVVTPNTKGQSHIHPALHDVALNPCGTRKYIEIDALLYVKLNVVCIEKGL